jgi:hypothetical protein
MCAAINIPTSRDLSRSALAGNSFTPDSISFPFLIMCVVQACSSSAPELPRGEPRDWNKRKCLEWLTSLRGGSNDCAALLSEAQLEKFKLAKTDGQDFNETDILEVLQHHIALPLSLATELEQRFRMIQSAYVRPNEDERAAVPSFTNQEECRQFLTAKMETEWLNDSRSKLRGGQKCVLRKVSSNPQIHNPSLS